MRTVFVVDLDRVVINCEPRAHKARITADQALAGVTPYLSQEERDKLWKQVFYHPTVFYRPEWIREDQMVAQADMHLSLLEKEGEILFLTSRLTNLTKITHQQLTHFGVLAHRRIILKPEEMNWTPTVIWKASTVALLTLANTIDRVVLIDDEEKIRNKTEDVLKHTTVQQQFLTYSSLEEAVRLFPSS